MVWETSDSLSALIVNGMAIRKIWFLEQEKDDALIVMEQDIQLKLALFVQVQEKLQIFVTGTHV